MSLSDDLRRMADQATELERQLYLAESEAEKLARDNDEACDTIESLRASARVAGLREQARLALEMAGRYLAEGDDIATSQRLQDALLQAVASATEAKEAA